jgi:hypothetical protein
MGRPVLAAALVLAGPAAAAEPSPEPPDAEFLEFLGETGGADPELLEFVESRVAKPAPRDAAKEEPKEDDDE